MAGMTDVPFLIAHRVRGEAAFDIAIKQPCPLCHHGMRDSEEVMTSCDECEGQGFWWICSTSGHRAYPYWNINIDRLLIEDDTMGRTFADLEALVPEMPEGLVDHYRVNSSPKPLRDAGRSLLAKLGLGRSAAPIKRRI